MSEGPSQLRGPDLRQGVALNSLVDGEMLLGHVGGEPALLVRRGADLFAVGATCTHYGGPLSVDRDLPSSVVIIGGGGAGNAAAETLRREGYAGAITLLSAEASPPCDRPNLSKDYLAGTAEADWIPLRPQEFYSERTIDLKLGVRVAAIEPGAHALVMEDGQRLSYGALLLTTGAEPIRLEVPGAALPHVRVSSAWKSRLLCGFGGCR